MMNWAAHYGRSLLMLTMVCVGANANTAAGQQLEIRWIGQADAASDCLGDPRTPLCAVETLIACFVRQDISLCRKVGVNDVSLGEPTAIEEYAVLRSFEVTAELIPEELKDARWYKPGDFDFELQQRYCVSERPASDCSGWELYHYSVRRIGAIWHIAGWAAETPAFVE